MVLRQGFIAALLALVAATMVLGTTSAQANSKYAAIVIHADTGDILFDKYSTQKRYPASLTKMMTLYLLFEELDAGRLTLKTPLKVSAFAAGQPPSKLGVKTGTTITVEKAIEALIIDSSNDVAVVVAEKIGRTERNFAVKMTRKARAMGMRNTTFRNASGLPDRRQKTTARDLAILAQRVSQDFPQYYHYFSQKSFTYNGVTHKTHNRVVGRLTGATGLKTGYTRASGYNLATAADRDGEHLIGIVLGGRSTRTRDNHMIAIMNENFKKIKKNPRLLASYHRKKPVPALKPTTLAALGGTWPPADTTRYAKAEAPTIAGSDTLRGQIITASLDLGAPDGLTTEDDIELLLNMTEAEKLNYRGLMQAEAENQLAQGDLDLRNPDLAWSIQIGAFRDTQTASTSAEEALKLATPWLENGEKSVTPVNSNGSTLYRTRIKSLTDEEAEAACSVLIQAGRDCFTLRDRDISDG